VNAAGVFNISVAPWSAWGTLRRWQRQAAWVAANLIAVVPRALIARFVPSSAATPTIPVASNVAALNDCKLRSQLAKAANYSRFLQHWDAREPTVNMSQENLWAVIVRWFSEGPSRLRGQQQPVHFWQFAGITTERLLQQAFEILPAGLMVEPS
jgi:hypothetical protein